MKGMKKIPIIFLFILVFSTPLCYGEYSIVYNEDTTKVLDSDGAETTDSFWDLPHILN
jgi:hypothetical protein